MKENIIFFKEFVTEFQTTGSCFPTSRWAAEALTDPIREHRAPKKILELGPGTGSVTKQILADMIPGDELTICEINERFMRTLKAKLASNPDYLSNKDRIDFFMGPMQDLPEIKKYDLVVCALPFLNFTSETVKEIFEKLTRLASDDAIMTYYEYIGIRSVRKAVGSEPSKKKFKELDRFFKDVYRSHETKKKRIWLNVMPINIYTLKLSGDWHQLAA